MEKQNKEKKIALTRSAIIEWGFFKGKNGQTGKNIV